MLLKYEAPYGTWGEKERGSFARSGLKFDWTFFICYVGGGKKMYVQGKFSMCASFLCVDPR